MAFSCGGDKFDSMQSNPSIKQLGVSTIHYHFANASLVPGTQQGLVENKVMLSVNFSACVKSNW